MHFYFQICWRLNPEFTGTRTHQQSLDHKPDELTTTLRCSTIVSRPYKERTCQLRPETGGASKSKIAITYTA